MEQRQCPFCGKHLRRHLAECPHCHETLPQVRISERPRGEGGQQIRRGLLYMFLAAVVQYFAGGYSPMHLPFPVSPIVTLYLSPLLFLSGLGLSLYGFYRHVTS